MSFKINRLHIRNFKTFRRVELSVSGASLVVLDGPNGFGKTSFFDAMELLLTGTVSRYLELEKIAVDRRSQALGCPLLHDGAKQGEFLAIAAEVEVDSEVIYLERSADFESLSKAKGVSDSRFRLYELNSLSTIGSGTLISNEDVFLNRYLGEDYKRNFNLFHYVEQEENTAILKNKDKDKQQKIAHLFDIGDYKDKLTKLESLKKSISKLKSKEVNVKLSRLADEVQRLKGTSLPEKEFVPYHRLVDVTNQPWDAEELLYDANSLYGWIAEDGILRRIQLFCFGFSDYLNELHNREINKSLLPNERSINALLSFGHRLDNINSYKDEVSFYEYSIRMLEEIFPKLIDSIKNDKLALMDGVIDRMGEDFSVDQFEEDKSEIKKLVGVSQGIAASISKLVSVRTSFIETFKEYEKHTSDKASCPACGHDWGTSGKLHESLDKQTQILRRAAEENGGVLNNKLTKFRDNFIGPIKAELEKYVASQKAAIEYKRKASNLEEKQIDFLVRYKQRILKFGVDVSDLFVSGYDVNEPLKVDEFKERIVSRYKYVSYENIYEFFDEIYATIFDNNEKAVKVLDQSSIDHKIKYIQQAYGSSFIRELRDKEKGYEYLKERVRCAGVIEKHVNVLLKIYKDSIKEHLVKISRDIELLFHIYTGRLLQSYNQGLGIFIDNRGDSISFRENPSKEHDVIFSMSSGQLSSLVIAFTLALNNRYSKHSILLIDDPLQTLDEINVAGFVDLIRSEFSDRQLFVSTHEDNMSAFMRYKFRKSGLLTRRINFRDVSGEIEFGG
ncbi:AAA family ATPase [Marinobacter sp. GN3S48]|uniref:AAA family ATPase n=1 Tax=Marinobacter sp. GN3S48 TaxID=3382302 RepID=UPI00387B83FB